MPVGAIIFPQQELANSMNKIYSDDTTQGVRYAEPVISDNQELNECLKGRFKKLVLLGKSWLIEGKQYRFTALEFIALEPPTCT